MNYRLKSFNKYYCVICLVLLSLQGFSQVHNIGTGKKAKGTVDEFSLLANEQLPVSLIKSKVNDNNHTSLVYADNLIISKETHLSYFGDGKVNTGNILILFVNKLILRSTLSIALDNALQSSYTNGFSTTNYYRDGIIILIIKTLVFDDGGKLILLGANKHTEYSNTYFQGAIENIEFAGNERVKYANQVRTNISRYLYSKLYAREARVIERRYDTPDPGDGVPLYDQNAVVINDDEFKDFFLLSASQKASYFKEIDQILNRKTYYDSSTIETLVDHNLVYYNKSFENLGDSSFKKMRYLSIIFPISVKYFSQLQTNQNYQNELGIYTDVEYMFDNTLPMEFDYFSSPDEIYSQWILKQVDFIKTELKKAQFKDDHKRQFDLINKTNIIIDARVKDNYINDFNKGLSDIIEVKKLLSLQLFPTKVHIDNELFGGDYTLLSEGVSNSYKIIPTHAFLIPYRIGSEELPGLIQLDPLYPYDVFLTLRFDLGIDPYLEYLLKKELSAKGKSYRGLFDNYTLAVLDLKSLGAKFFEKTIDIDKNKIAFKIQIQKKDLNLFLLNLFMTEGVGVEFLWTYKKNTAIINTFYLPLSTSRISNAPMIRQDPGQVSNQSGLFDAVIRYVKCEDEMLLLDQSLLIKSNDKFKLQDNKQLAICKSVAVNSTYCKFSAPLNNDLDRLFYRVPDNAIEKEIIFINDFDSKNADGVNHTYLQIVYSYNIAGRTYSEKVELNPQPAGGSTKHIKIFTLNAGYPDLEIHGTVFYDSNSDPLKFTKKISSQSVIRFKDSDIK